MKKIFFGFGLIFILATGLTLWLALLKTEFPSLDLFIQQRWPQLVSGMSKTEELDLTHLLSEARPAELSHLDLLVPHFQNFKLEELQDLFSLSRNCQQKIKRPKSADLQKPWLWVASTCFQQKLPKDFFKKPPFLFPSGQSYVQLAEDFKFNFSGYLTTEEIKTFKSISEMFQISTVGSDLNLQQIGGFLQGEDILIGENFIYLKTNLRTESTRTRLYSRVPRETWRTALKEESYVFTDFISENCLLTTTNGCWVTNRSAAFANRQFYLTIVIVLDGIIVLLALLFFWVDRRRRQKLKENQRFTLQMLTHELRTPVTTLGLQLENIRHDFDHLSPSQQAEFLKMSQEIARLKNSMQMSYAYLQTDAIHDNKLKIIFEKIDLNKVLQDLVDVHNSTFKDRPVHFVTPKEPNPLVSTQPKVILDAEPNLLDRTETKFFVEAEPQWLALCINNLLRNAFDHGRPPVTVSAFSIDNEIAVQVTDAGSIQQNNLNSLTIPFQKGHVSKGLGLGLSILQQVVQEMNGRLDVERNPTRFTIYLRRSP